MNLVRAVAVVLWIVTFATPTAGAIDFDDTFVDATLRVDLYLVGNAEAERVVLDRLIHYPGWAGPVHGAVDPGVSGRFVARLVAPDGGATLYRYGFDSLFGEYQTTDPARSGTWRVFHESVLLPYPRRTVRLIVSHTAPDGADQVLLDTVIDPGTDGIVAGRPRPGVRVIEHHVVGPPSTTLDIAIIGEGYTVDDIALFRADLARFGDLLLSQQPYADARDRISVRGVLLPSDEPGCDEPTRGIWRDTALGASFNTLGSPRYLLTESNRDLRDIAANAPYDALIIMINHERYGGGGIFNRYCSFTAHGPFAGYLMLHEFGHSFGGLADEYYTSSTSYTDFYPAGFEPVEPNISATADRAAIKWADLISPETPMPTPWGKAQFDRADIGYQEVRRSLDRAIARAAKSGTMQIVRDLLTRTAEAHAADRVNAVDRFMADSGLLGTVGAFEGAGYVSQ
ncbi:MAG: M64 family metallopeptidase, partial [Holophagae bacterium]